MIQQADGQSFQLLLSFIAEIITNTKKVKLLSTM